MTKPANSKDKPSPADTPTERPDDNGGKAKVEKTDKEYDGENANFGNIQKKAEEQEQPVMPVKDAPKE